MAGRLRNNQKLQRFVGSISNPMTSSRQNVYSFARNQPNLPTTNFHHCFS